ncbi:uncharacterized protein LOC142224663 [Haematobia irritans]|uniref:uncharacterized protein LOC142224663 n=1 Tax=Haematobia irritans TaxID=7368 RepID=UPI003F4F73DF
MSLDRFIRIADNLVVFEANLNDRSQCIPMASVHSIEVHKEELTSIWEKLKYSYELCVADIENEARGTGEDEKSTGDKGKDDEDEGSELEMVRNKYTSSYITYCRCSTRLRELLHELSNPTSGNAPRSDASSSFGFKFPPCDIPTFGGDYSSWPTFRDIFEAICIRNPILSSVEKLFHLNQKTKGEANDIVRKVPLTNENFDVAWNNLCSRYENKRVLINIQLKRLFGLSHLSSESAASLKTLQRDINSCISLLQMYEVNVESWDPIFIFVCCNCLPNSVLTLWEQTLSDKATIPKWSHLDSFLTNRHRTLESVSEIRKGTSQASGQTPRLSSTMNSKQGLGSVRSFQNRVSEPQCHLCPKEYHLIRKCPKFLKMSHENRFAEIRKSNMCRNCFSKVHTARNCKSKYACSICHKRHHTLLHKGEEAPSTQQSNPSSDLNPTSAPFPSTSKTIQSTDSQSNNVIRSCFSTNSKAVLLGTALVNICHNGVTYCARALVDSGSEATFISERLFNTLRLPFKRTCATISGLNNTVSASAQKLCSLTLGSTLDPSIAISASALVVPHLSGGLPSRAVDPAILSQIPRIPLADLHFFKNSNIDILLGGDLFPSIMMNGIKNNVCGSLVAQETIFGWILTGPIPIHITHAYSTLVSYHCEISLGDAISRFWEVEDPPRRRFRSVEDQFCEDLYIRSTKRDGSGRYIVSLPFKQGLPEMGSIGESRKSAIAQFYRNEARLLRTPNFKAEYDEVLDEYVRLGHMAKVSPPSSIDTSTYFYLPHHAVMKPESTTTKVRVVFNASATTANGSSLNSLLDIGPVLQNDRMILILRWRFYRFVFNGDITKMYRQILVDPSHTPFQRIIFRGNPQYPIQDFELKTVTFGVNCAPYLAVRTLLQLADDIQSTYPLASSILRNSMYVDDALAGAHSISVAKEARQQLVRALASAGFSMRKWTSNCREILSDIDLEDLLCDDFLQFDDRSTAKTLGIRWNAMSDCFLFLAEPFSDSVAFSKREILSQISKLFDPAGWLSPCIIVAKILMQSIWLEKTEWDQQVFPHILSQWESFRQNYPLINSLRIPRWLHFTPDSEIQFHGFCDASEKAYAAVLYARIRRDNTIFTSLVCSKTRVAPVKTLSIPRLELCGAALLADMIDNILPRFNLSTYTLHCWTDSTIVLSWLSKPPCFWATFVANRVSKIIEVVNPVNWSHVTSESNPADLASRGVTPQEILENSLWWQGPEWLSKSEDCWSKEFPIDVENLNLDRKPTKVNFSYFETFDDLLERFSSFAKAIRVMAYVYRFYFGTHPRYRVNYIVETHAISTSEILTVRTRLISLVQKVHYPTEYHALTLKTSIPKSSSLISMNPFLDAEGIMRSCAKCQSQLMSALPPERIEISRPFIHTGLDFAGPFDIKNYAGRACIITKGYALREYWQRNFFNLPNGLYCPITPIIIFHGTSSPLVLLIWGPLGSGGEELQNTFSIESCLNSRPLSPMSQDPSDFDALTPGHFLIGSPILAPIEPKIHEAPMSLVNRWQRLKAIHQHFCCRWKNEYLKELHKRYKWQREKENIRENMVVAIRDDNPPNSWRLGRISKLHFGVDNKVRVADIITQRGTITRPIAKLLPMRNNRRNNLRQNQGGRRYMCRLCRKPHALRKCHRFLDMNCSQREYVVKSYGYCVNCLALNHSEGTCFTKTGCRLCHEKHHTLLHFHPRLQHQTSPERDSKHSSSKPNTTAKMKKSVTPTESPRSEVRPEQTSLTAQLKQNTITLLPTILVNVAFKEGHKTLRCLLDSGTRSSCISSRIVDELGITTLTLHDEKICPLALSSIHNPNVSIQTILKVNNRISITTPNPSISSPIREKFHNLLLADSTFYRSSKIDVIFGVDTYAKVQDTISHYPSNALK